MNRMNKSIVFTIITSFILVILFAIVIVLFSSFYNKSILEKKLCVDCAYNNLISNKNVKTKISKEEVYTYKIPARLDLTKVLKSNFEKDRPKTIEIDSSGKPTGKKNYFEYDSFFPDDPSNPIIRNSIKKYVDYKNLKLKKVSEFSELEKLTLYSVKGIEPLSRKESLYLKRINSLLDLCVEYYRKTGKVPDDLWDFGFFRDTVQSLGKNWKAGFDELITLEPGNAYFISPITGGFFSFNNPQYKKGQMYIQPITDQNFIKANNMVGPNDTKIEINKNCWMLYYRVYGEDPNTIIQENLYVKFDLDNLLKPKN